MSKTPDYLDYVANFIGFLIVVCFYVITAPFAFLGWVVRQCGFELPEGERIRKENHNPPPPLHLQVRPTVPPTSPPPKPRDGSWSEVIKGG